MSNALMMAAWKQHEDCCRLLVESGADINSTGTRNKETRTPLQAAASKGNLSLVKALLELGADVNLLGGDKGSTLLAAIDNDRRNPEVVKVLLDNGANVDEKVSPSVISYGFALGAAVGNRDLSITRLLIDGGADVNLLNAHYKSSIQLASSCDDPSFLDLLLEHGGDVNLVTKPSDPFYDGEITPLQEAVWAEKETNVQRLLSLGANLSVDVEKSRFKSALQVAAYKGYSSLVKILIEAGSDVNEEGGEDGTALQAATEDGHTEVVRILLDNKANANERKCGQYGSALLCAAQKNHLEIARLLIEHGADPNIKAGPPYQYPLQAAAYFELEDMVTLLLDIGADVNSRGGQWGTALQAAAVDGSHDVMKILVDRGADVDIQAGFYGNALGAAYRHGYYYCTGLLYEHNVNNSVATRSRYGSPMGSALQGGACQTLLNQLVRYHNVNVNLAYGKYGNPLQHCIAMEREQVIFEAIIDYGANLNAIGGRYGTALNATLVDNHLDQAQYLLGKGADLNVRGNALYYSPLQCAIRGKSMDCFNAMLEKGCDVSEIGGYFGSPLQLAAFTGQIKMVKALVRRGATVNTIGAGHYGCALIAAAIRGHEDIVRYLLKKGADVSARGSPFGSFFHCAVLCLSRDIIELCLRRGVPVNLKAGVFCTPLQAAASRGNVSIVLLLLAHGADVTIRGGKYNTALQAAGAYGDQEACKILIERGADVNAEGGMHKTPLQAAATCRQADTVKVLLDNGAEWKLCNRSVGRVHSQAYDWADEILNKAVEQLQEDDGDEEWEDEEEKEDEVEAEGEEEEVDGKEDVGEGEDGNEGDSEEEIEEEPLEMNVESIPDFEKEYIPPPPAPESISVPEPTSSVEVTDSTSCATVPAEPESSQDHGQESQQPQSSTSGPSSNASPSPPMSPVKPTRTKSNPLVTQLEVQPSSEEDAGTTDGDEAWNELAWLQVTCGWGGDLAGPGRETD
jgi:ankyrin repeat protein